MKNSGKEVSVVGQSNNEGKKSQKHEANLQKNSTLYFQIGLILCLLASYALFEMQFKKTAIPIPGETAIVRSISVDYVTPFQIEDNKPKVSEVPPSEELLDKYKEVKDDIPTIETQIIIPEEKKPLTIPSAIESIYGGEEDLTENEDIVIINSVEVVPIYPGCETYETNIKRKKCMSDKIAKLINRKFNTNVASNHGTTGIQRIYTQFTIDKDGNVIDIKARGPHSVLEEEAKRVIEKIPTMRPGLQQNKPVGVIYTLPIMLQIRD